MAAKKQAKPAPKKDEPARADEKPNYTRAGGHVLTDKGWVPEELVEQLGATPTRVDEG